MKKVTFTFVSAKGYDLSFTRYLPDDDFFHCLLDELEVLNGYVNTKEDFDTDTLSRILVEY